MTNMLMIKKVQFWLDISSFLVVSNISFMSYMFPDGHRVLKQQHKQSHNLKHWFLHAVDVFGTCWILCRLYLLGSAALTAVSVFDSQVLVFSSLLFWALQSATQLLPIKKKINWDATQGLSKTAVTFSRCLFTVSSILTTQPSTLMNQSKHSTGWSSSSSLSAYQTCN